jgi:excisionase family DNA binding protein
MENKKIEYIIIMEIVLRGINAKMNKLYKTIEVAKLFDVSLSFIYKKAEKGELASIKIGSALRFSEENINEYLEKCKNR